MTTRAGFAEIDITPVPGTRKIGWLREVIGQRVLDPLFARAAVFEVAGDAIGFLQLDLLSIRWTQVRQIREGIQEAFGFPGERIMVSATHNHAGPAVCTVGDVPRDEAYIESLVQRCVRVFGEALERQVAVEIGFAHDIEPDIAFNRRMIMRDGTVKCQERLSPKALCLEGPADPELGLLAVRDGQRNLLGCLVNFTCHPTEHGGDDCFSAGYPGVLARRLKARGCPATLFLNGASGNIQCVDLMHQDAPLSMQKIGCSLADRVTLMLSEMQWQTPQQVNGASRTLALPYRDPSLEEQRGQVHGAQRFIDPALYDRGMPAVVRRIRERKTNPAEVQVLGLDDHVWVGIPAEYFVEYGLRIKEQAWPTRAWVVGQANGMVGYVPTREAFRRGGYETTFFGSSRLAPEAGDRLADAAVELIESLRP